jgi:hypothetical protein
MRSLVGLLGPVVAGFFAASDAAVPLVCFAVASALGAVAAAMLPFETGGRELKDHSAGAGADVVGARRPPPPPHRFADVAAVPVAGNTMRSRLLQ